ncbi:hypothetical protein [Sulfobacillus harzensis]|uniref:Uncharacterized protein n=1 Tax=Sulfobacillus harzensis TaxID=2729629 RepID=A0A7Y0L3D3_9FIRM|nr:hypothetical protein [Sulfobacillus harzensis]NMP22333.1 hypothetical protein [Sulfobacillus harzensis]
MDPKSRLLENMFNVDLFALVWIAVAIVVITALAWNFYQGLAVEDASPSSAPAPAMPLQTRWLGLIVATWWASDLVWHSRAVVVTPSFYRPLIRADLMVPWLHWAAMLWEQNPILWDFAALMADAGLVLGLAFSYRRHPRWLLWAAALWGTARWLLTASSAPWGAAHPFGPGGYLLAGASAYLMLAPSRYRAVLSLAAVLLAIDAGITSYGLHNTAHLGLGIGLMGVAYGAWRHWTALSFRILALFVSIDLLTQHVGTAALMGGMNQLWVPLLFFMALGLHLDTQVKRHQERIGG